MSVGVGDQIDHAGRRERQSICIIRLSGYSIFKYSARKLQYVLALCVDVRNSTIEINGRSIQTNRFEKSLDPVPSCPDRVPIRFVRGRNLVHREFTTVEGGLDGRI